MIHHPIGDKAYDETPGCAPVRQLRLCVQICLKQTRYCLGQSQHEDLGRIAWRGAAQIQIENRLNCQPIMQVESLGHFRSSSREGEALDLLRRSDGVPAGASQKETPPGFRETAT
jgi:hypothetical protein